MIAEVLLPGHPLDRIELHYDELSDVQRGMAESLTDGTMYEPGTWQAFHDLLRPGDRYIDVGAHVGTFACLAAALVGPTGKVFAFEPDSKNRRGLIRNGDRNDLTWMTVYPHACADITGRTVLHHCADNDGGHALWNPGLSSSNVRSRAKPAKKMVNVTQLDVMCEGPVRLIKIDVEGAETKVVTGAMDLIRRNRPAVIAEINVAGMHHMGTTEHELRSIFQRLAYREYAIQDSAPFYVPLTPESTVQPTLIVNGVRCLVVWNMLFVPSEWPENEEWTTERLDGRRAP